MKQKKLLLTLAAGTKRLSLLWTEHGQKAERAYGKHLRETAVSKRDKRGYKMRDRIKEKRGK